MTQRAPERDSQSNPASIAPLHELIQQHNELLRRVLEQLKDLSDAHHFMQGQVFDALGRLSQGQRRLWHAIETTARSPADRRGLGEPPDEVTVRPPLTEPDMSLPPEK